ncbi:MAG: hypothetical protein ACJ76H_10975 [Bacteriovoracaceae bacterium]
MKLIAGIFIGLALASTFFLTRPKSVPEKTKSEFQHFSVNEARKFAEAKTPDEKLKAAEELYGKMMILFLADLGLQLQKSQPVTEIEPPEEKVAVTDSVKEIVKTECAPCAQAKNESAPAKKEVAKKLSMTDKFKASAYVSKMDSLIQKMSGVFSGKLTNFAGPRRGRVDNALMDVELVQKQQTLDGSIQVILTDENGIPYSRNRGKGGNKTIRYSPADKMVYVEASPTSFFVFRAGDFNDNDVTGEYYENDILSGRAILYRQ